MSQQPLLISFHDNTSLPGFWDPQTSFANFCEIDYAITFYIAEFVNTISNLAYVYFALCSPAFLSPKGSLKELDQDGRLKRRPPVYIETLGIDLHSLNLILVGICSLLYHATLRNVPNALDQVSMFFLAAGFVYDLYTFNLTSSTHHQIMRWSCAFLLTVCLTSSIYVIVTTGNLDLHSNTFATLLVLTGLRIIYLIWNWEGSTNSKTPRDSHAGGAKSESKTSSASDLRHSSDGASTYAVTRYQLFKSFVTAIMFMVVAFGLWIIDIKFCHELRAFRSTLPLPVACFFELHGWWHFLTARAAGEYLALVRTLTLTKRKEEH